MRKDYTEQELTSLRSRHEKWLMAQPGVVGTSIGLSRGGSVCLRIFTQDIPDESRDAIKDKLKQVPLDWEETKGFMAY